MYVPACKQIDHSVCGSCSINIWVVTKSKACPYCRHKGNYQLAPGSEETGVGGEMFAVCSKLASGLQRHKILEDSWRWQERDYESRLQELHTKNNALRGTCMRMIDLLRKYATIAKHVLVLEETLTKRPQREDGGDTDKIREKAKFVEDCLRSMDFAVRDILSDEQISSVVYKSKSLSPHELVSHDDHDALYNWNREQDYMPLSSSLFTQRDLRIQDAFRALQSPTFSNSNHDNGTEEEEDFNRQYVIVQPSVMNWLSHDGRVGHIRSRDVMDQLDTSLVDREFENVEIGDSFSSSEE